MINLYRQAFTLKKPLSQPMRSWFLLSMLTVSVSMTSGCQPAPVRHHTQAEPKAHQPVDTEILRHGDKPSSIDAKRLASHLKAGVITTDVLTIKSKAAYADAPHLPYANPNAPKGGKLSMPVIGMFNSLNSFIDSGVAATGTFYLYDTLMAGSLDEVNVLYPQLADAVSYHPDEPDWVIYHINPKARFWDGQAVSAYDVKATFDAILSDGLMSWRAFLGGIEYVEVLDSQRVKFYFKADAPSGMNSTVGLMPVFAKHDIDKRFKQVSLIPLMGSGPYQVASVQPSRQVSYVRDPNYWGRDLMVNRGRFNFNEINYQYYQDEAVAFSAFKAGQYNLRIENDIKYWANLKNSSASSARAMGDIQLISIANKNPVLMQGLVMNLRRPFFSDVRVRQALNLAFDFEWLNQKLLYGEYQRLNSHFFGSSLQAVGAPSADERLILNALPLNDYEKSALDGVARQPTSAGDGINRANLLKARDLLVAAGYTVTDSKLIDRQGNAVTLKILIDDDKHLPALLPYQANLKRLGIDVHILRLDAASYVAHKRRYDFDMLIDSFMQGSSPGAEQAYLWGSAAADTIGGANTIGIKSAAIDMLINKLSKLNNQADIERHARVLDRLLLAGHYMIPWYGKTSTDIAYRSVIQHPARTPAYSVGLDYWWYDADR